MSDAMSSAPQFDSGLSWNAPIPDTEERLHLLLAEAREAMRQEVALVATKDAAIDAMAVVIVTRDATIARVMALLGDHHGPLWAARGVREADIRTALGMPQP
jgi:hypothetical protein